MTNLLHQRRRSKASLTDDYETPNELYDQLCNKYKVYPTIDVCANAQNTKCIYYIDEEMNALETEWNIGKVRDGVTLTLLDTEAVWCNPPYSLTGDFVKCAYEQHLKHNLTIMMLIPTNTMSSAYWHEYIEGKAEYHPIKGRIRFLLNGKPTPFASRNANVLVIWRKK